MVQKKKIYIYKNRKLCRNKCMKPESSDIALYSWEFSFRFLKLTFISFKKLVYLFCTRNKKKKWTELYVSHKNK